jgi:hypothetical protein
VLSGDLWSLGHEYAGFLSLVPIGTEKGKREVMPRTNFQRRGPEVGFGEIAIDLLQSNFRIADNSAALVI